MQVRDDGLIFSASDLLNFLECERLTWLDLEDAHGRLGASPKRADTAELVARKGDEHERRHLETLREAHGDDLVEIDSPKGPERLAQAADETRAAMAAGAPAIFQATFFQNGWRGHADFLERVDEPSELGDWSYEVLDTKLARSVKPYFVVQLCLYSEMVAGVQGRMPAEMHLLLGTGERKSLAVADFAAYYRRMKSHFVASLGNGLAETYPDPVPHCGLCKWSDVCDARRESDDHLSLVARMTRPQTVKLNAAGIDTVADLAIAEAADRPLAIGEPTFERLRQQARLQVDERETGRPSYELLEPETDAEKARRGFALLPRPSEGDVFFDIEGDPFYEDGLEYLWGVTYLEEGQEMFLPFWGRDRSEERQAFEGFIDFVMDRRRRYPDMHVYHYAPYEPTALKRLMGLHATREDEVDELLRQNVLVDLYRVVEQGLRISQPSYSLKKVELFYMPDREASVTDGEDSILKFEEWLEKGDDSLLEWIRAYNEEDCRSTLLLRSWLLERRRECEDQYSVEISWRPLGESKPADEATKASQEVLALQARLFEGVPDDPAERSPDEHSRWLLAQLIDYHRREDKPYWWEFFSRFEKSAEELQERDGDALARLRVVGEPQVLPPPARSTVHTLSFPAQEHKISAGTFTDPFTAGPDPATGELNPFSATKFKVTRVLDEKGRIEISRASNLSQQPLPTALIPSTYFNTEAQRVALRELADIVIERGVDATAPFSAAKAILRRAVPDTAAARPGTALQIGEADLSRTTEIVTGLRDSYLFIQGPPGSGKTYTGAKLILTLLAQGARVGVTANSHKAINNLLHEVEKHAGDQAFRGLQKRGSDAESEFKSKLPEPLVESSGSNSDFPTAEGVELMAGTAWLWCREEMRQSVDYLVIDEAGQISLADAVALATAARNVILLGDPLQLAQVSQGTHPAGAGGSVLEHLLGDDGTVPPERGIFLDHTRRMHPDVCDFVSEAIYEGRLSAIPECSAQRVDCDGPLTGTGVRTIPMEHQGNGRQSTEEAERIAEAIARMVPGSFTCSKGTTRPLLPSDFMVVTPYNAQVRCLRAALDARDLADVPVGTVDKFQGQESSVVFFSMATSSGAEVPRNVEFLYSRNRLNVAASRARCLAVLVSSPALLTIRCRTVEQMRLVNALCRLGEMGPSRPRDPAEGILGVLP